MSENKMIPIGGLWLNTKGDIKYFSGNLGTAKLLIFKNKYKKTDTHPDYQMYVAPKEKKKTETSNDTPSDDVPF